jgi:hypothetical protein
MKIILLLIMVVLLIRTIRYELPCPSGQRTVDGTTLGCAVFHYHERKDSTVVSMEYIQKNYAHPKFSEDSSVCFVTENGFR